MKDGVTLTLKVRFRPGDLVEVYRWGCIIYARYQLGIYSAAGTKTHDNLKAGTIATVVGQTFNFTNTNFVDCIWSGGRGLLPVKRLEPFLTASMRKKQ